MALQQAPRKLLAAFAAMRRFQSSVKGRRCIFYTDHSPYAQALCQTTNPWSPWQQCQLSALTEFLMDVVYLPGACNLAGDALSHSPVSSVSFGVVFCSLALQQRSSDVTCAYHTAISGLELWDVSLSRWPCIAL